MFSLFLHAVQVDRQERACRKELERALTRAALDQDIDAIDEAEGIIAQKEHRLERLLTQSNVLQAAMVSILLPGKSLLWLKLSLCQLAHNCLLYKLCG